MQKSAMLTASIRKIIIEQKIQYFYFLINDLFLNQITSQLIGYPSKQTNRQTYTHISIQKHSLI